MFYKLIEKKRNEWLASSECTVRQFVSYIETKGMMRDAQIEAIKTYLFLKIACDARPLWQLFVEGRFNSYDFGQIELTEEARSVLRHNKAAAALFEYSRLTDRNGRQLAPDMEQFIKLHTEEINYERVFRDIFYGVGYTDYLFSLPMGAGKTYLMAAFMYIDLYFALNEPDNRAFAHNFMVLAPSGLKSSIVPSLKKIVDFDPSWVIPEPAASQIKRMMSFDILDERKGGDKGNAVINPNAQKITRHGLPEDDFGLVFITNAEKVILDRYDDKTTPDIGIDKSEWLKTSRANELRDIIGRIANLAVFVDEVHHVADSEIKLRRVVGLWAEKHSFCSMIGFSGTPYLPKAEEVKLAGQFAIKNTDLSNVVYHYPLIRGIGNFLKDPKVRYCDNDTLMNGSNGLRDFLDRYRDTVYPDGTRAKIAIYCGKIETLEETVSPLVFDIVSSYGMDAARTVLRYHGGNRQYPQPEGSAEAFAALDTPWSEVRVVLLVQIGKEGWDCKSLTSVVLPQKGACPTNMVLQTSCRCLRQVVKGEPETALIWLNKSNADTLNKQLKQQQNISIQEFNTKRSQKPKRIERFSRMEKIRLPRIDYYQLKISYTTETTDDGTNVADRLDSDNILRLSQTRIIHEGNMEGNIVNVYQLAPDGKEQEMSFIGWLMLIAKEGFNTTSFAVLWKYSQQLRTIYDTITHDKDGVHVLSNRYDQPRIRSLIRSAFSPRRRMVMKEETVCAEASLLDSRRLTSPITVADDRLFCPSQTEVREIMDNDTKKENVLTEEQQRQIEALKATGVDIKIDNATPDLHHSGHTFHYLPYRFDSSLEKRYFADELLSLEIFKEKNLEVYYNGDDNLTAFFVDCYKRTASGWRYIGKYYPDFLLMRRTEEGSIDRAIIIETKGEGFAAKFADRRRFMQDVFVSMNEKKFGYRRFGFLYIEDSMTENQRRIATINAIESFFKS